MQRVEMWRLLALCGCIGIVVFLLAAAVVFCKMKVYQSFWYFFKMAQRKRRWKRRRKQNYKLYMAGFAAVAVCVFMLKIDAGAQEMFMELLPVVSCCQVDGTDYYDKGVKGYIQLQGEQIGERDIMLCAVPRDQVAEEAVGQCGDSSDSCENGYYEILNREIKEDRITFLFQLQGKWQIVLSDKEGELKTASEEFIIDQKAPELSVVYENVRDISDISASTGNVNRRMKRGLKAITSPDCEVSAAGKGKVTVKIQEDYFSAENVKINIWKENYENRTKDNVTKQWEQYVQAEGKWKQEGDDFILQYQWEEEGHYQFQIEYEDHAGNALMARKDDVEGKETASCMEEGVYEGPVYTLDNTAPVLRTFAYVQSPEKVQGTRSYFTDKPTVKIEIEEENFNGGDFSLRDILTLADGSLLCPVKNEDSHTMTWTSHYEEGKRINTAELEIKEEANHTFSGWVTDGCGWKSPVQTGECTYDTTPPEIEVRVWGEDYFMPYKSYQYFGQEQFRVSVSARDDISGVQLISYYFGEENEKDKNHMEWASVICQNEKTDVRKENLLEYCIEIRVNQKDFKGRIYVQAENFAGKKSEEVSSPGLLLASKAMHKNSSTLSFELSEADYTDEEARIKYYRNPVMVTAHGEDSHAGIAQFRLWAGDGKKIITDKKADKTKNPDISYQKTLTMDIKPEKFRESCKEQPVEIKVSLTDNSGYVSTAKYKEYKIVLDDIQPEIRVAYDIGSAKNGKYYNCTRTATVTVRDRNFNPDSVRWEIAGSNQKYRISQWTGDGEIYRCQVVFAEDGKDYRIRLSAEDYAGNKAVWDGDTAFTIDKTPPVIRMEIDAGDAENGKYYRTAQDVTFSVEDNNINTENAAVYIQKEELEVWQEEKTENRSKEETISLRPMGENTYQAVKRYKKDGEYCLQFQCTDLAGNVTKTEHTLQFVIDRTEPDIRVEGVADKMSYAGTVCPAIKVSDKNLDSETVHVQLKRIDGSQKTGRIAVETEEILGKRAGKRYTWMDVAHEEENDGIYQLQAYARDLAGNQKTLGGGILFTINRFGSVYVLQDEFQETLKKGYMREQEGIVITEYSVGPVDTRVTILKDNQSWRELYPEVHQENVQQKDLRRKEVLQQETRDGKYAVFTKKNSSGIRKGWYVKRHYISEKNFREEGTYQITLESSGYVVKNERKKVIKETSTALKGHPISFTVDRTPPVVQIGGLEEEYYEEEKHPFVITVMDNCEFAYMDLNIRYEDLNVQYGNEKEEQDRSQGRKRREGQTIRIMPEDLKSSHSVVKELSAWEGRQIISYQAWDRAGNCLDTAAAGEEISCVVMDASMADRWRRIEQDAKEIKNFIQKQRKEQRYSGPAKSPAFWVLMVSGLAAVFAGGVVYFRRKSRKNQKEKA